MTQSARSTTLLDALRDLALEAADLLPADRSRLLDVARGMDEPVTVVVGAVQPGEDERAEALAERLQAMVPPGRIERSRSDRLARRRPAAAVLVVGPDLDEDLARRLLRPLRAVGIRPANAIAATLQPVETPAVFPALAATALSLLAAPPGEEQQLATAIRDWFFEREDILRGMNAVSILRQSVANAEGSQAVDGLADRLEGLELSSPELRDASALSEILAQRLTLPPRLVEETTRLLGRSDPGDRLGLPPEATVEEIRAACVEAGSRWRKHIVEGRIPLAIRDAAAHVLTTYDRLGPAAGLTPTLRPAESTKRADPRVGTRLGSYLIEQQLGRGGMGVVYRAIQPRPRRRVALKLLAAAFSADEDFRLRFERESDVAAAISHPNIVPIFDAGEADGNLYMVMHYVEGSDLRSLLADAGTLTAPRALHLLAQVAAALDAAHAHGLVHRDVKPGNILVCSGQGGEARDHVYLGDFGLTRRVDSTSRITHSGNFLGTPDYAAPEQIEGKSVEGKADQYALACVMYECLTGAPPYAREIEWAVLNAHIHEQPPSVSSARDDLPPELDGVIARGLAKRPEDRFTSCLELIETAMSAVGLTIPMRGASRQDA